MISTFFPTKTLLSTLPHYTLSLASTSRLTQDTPSTLPQISSGPIETAHHQHPIHTPLHLTQRHSTSTILYRQARATPCGARVATLAHFLSAALFPRLPYYPEHTTRPTPHSSQPILPSKHPQGLSLGLSQAFLHLTEYSVPQTEEILAQGPHCHQLFSIHSRHTPPSNLQSIQHYATSHTNTAPWPTFYALWQQLHSQFTTTPEDIHLTAINDDLVGFFNSVPQQRLIDAVMSLCNRWHSQHTTTALTIEVQSTDPIQHSHIGRRYIHHPQQRTLDTKHIPLIVQQALQSRTFQACHTYYQQIQGAGIGSQLSPALCNVAITLIEHSWHQTYHIFLHQPSIHLFNTRYVDNRYILLNEHFRQALPITTLAHPEFYGDPVEIEPVEDNHLLGFHIDPLNRTVTFQLPTQPWQIRDTHSAGSHRLRLSGLQSRHHTLQQYTYPQHMADHT